jgi:hypothetical protein
MLSLSEGLVRFCPEAAIRGSAGGSGLFLSAANPVARPGLPRHDQEGPVLRVFQAMHSTPQRAVLAGFPADF